ncbi:MAG: T9SS type A sorting domain-containing protein [Bacteroidales bacterium]|nr:T9SS type A sorting domain-containing protein [Bacteroidales bacterium]
MKSLRSLKRIIFKFFLIICMGCFLNFHSFSNPIEIPPTILEIYFGSGDWSIELLISEFYGGNNLDNMRITGLYDTAQFLPGIEYTPGEVFFVTQADFQTPFYINQAGDCLFLEEQMGDEWWQIEYYGLQFGVISYPTYYSEVSAPAGEESVAWQKFSDSYDNYEFWTVKELPNTIGYNPFQVAKRAVFSGYVKDKSDEPLAGIKLYYCPEGYHYATSPTVPEIFTNENGYFYTDNMFCKKYWIRFLYQEGEIGDTTIFVEPDSANYFEFKLDTLLTGIGEYKLAPACYSIGNIPNPFSNNTTFVIETNGQVHHQKGIIKIYSSEGFIVDILPIEISGEKQELNYNLNDKSLVTGIYYYSLEIGNQKKVAGKMVISR